MNLILLPIEILEEIIKKINTTESYHNLRLTCKTFYELMPNIRRYYENGSLKEFIYFKKHEISGHQYTFHNEPLFLEDFEKRSYLGIEKKQFIQNH